MAARIVIADDEPNILISLEFLMKREGHEVFVARDGVEAVQAVQAHRPQLLLLDVMMPRKNGFEVCQELRADEALAGLGILMLTAKGRETDIAKGLALGADAYMTKPFSTRELVQKVNELLAAGRLGAGGGTAGGSGGGPAGAGSGTGGSGGATNGGAPGPA